MTSPNSPFNWKTNEPSVFAKDHAFNGVNSQRSHVSTQTVTPNAISLPGASKYLAPGFMKK